MKRLTSPRLCLYDSQPSARSSAYRLMLLQRLLRFNSLKTIAEYNRLHFPSQQRPMFLNLSHT
jgi:hypothetical protein